MHYQPIDISDTNFDRVIELPELPHGFESNIHGLLETPFDRTLFLDTDTYVEEPIFDLFETLDKYNICVAEAALKGKSDEYQMDNVPACIPGFNTGVIALDSSRKTRKTLKRWDELYSESDVGNQPSFRQAVYEVAPKIMTIPSEYNCKYDEIGHLVGEVKIYHGRLVMDPDIQGSPLHVNLEEARQKLGDPGQRIFVNSLGELHVKYRNWPDSLLESLLTNYRRHGVLGTIRKLRRKTD